MNYSLWTFRDWFEKHDISLSYRISDNKALIGRLVFMETYQKERDNREAVVIRGDALEDCSGFRSALCYHNDRLFFPVASPETIFNMANEMLSFYESWEGKLLEKAATGSRLPELLDVAAEVLPSCLAILNPKNGNICCSSGWKPKLSCETGTQILQRAQGNKTDSFVIYIPLSDVASSTLVAFPLEKEAAEGSYLLYYDKDRNLKPGNLSILSTITEILQASTLFNRQTALPLISAETTPFRGSDTTKSLSARILEACKQLPDTKTYIHPEIQQLAEYEALEKEPFIETLYQYLILGRSSPHASKALFIHRNTLRTRLEKIQRMLSFSIEDNEEIENVLISLILVKAGT